MHEHECRCCGKKGPEMVESVFSEEYFCDYDCMGFFQSDGWKPERGKRWRAELDTCKARR